jgi:hypothetical protein
LGAAARCVNSACVSLVENGCVIAGPITDDSALLFAVLGPTNGSAGEALANARNIVEEITYDWNVAAPAAGTKKAAAIYCDEANVEVHAKHFEELRPAFVVGPYTESKLKKFLQLSQIPTFGPLADDPSYQEQPENTRRLWACIPNRAQAVKPFLAAAEYLADKLKAERGADVRIAVIRTAEPDDVLFADRVQAGLHFNGAPVADQPANFSRVDLPFDPNVSASVLADAQRVAVFKPDLVLIAGPWASASMARSIDLRWAALNGTAPLPVYLQMQRFEPMEGVLAGSPTPSANRFYALDWERPANVAQNFTVLKARLQEAEIAVPFAGDNTVDCIYSALFGTQAAAATNNVALTSVSPTQLAEGMERASTGTDELNLLREDISKGISLLNARPPIKLKLVGAAAAYGFDVRTGVPSAMKMGLSCISSKTTQPPQRWSATGLRFDVATGVSDGTLACP